MKYSVILLLGLFPLLLADTLLVPSEYPSIHDAITAAQDGDTVLVSPGQYCGGFSFQGKNIVLQSTGGPGSTYIEAPFMDFHCVMFTGGEDSTAVIEGFSITNSSFDGTSDEGRDPVDHGGGIYIIDSSPTIMNNNIRNCVTSGSGAGIYISGSSPTLIGNTIQDNQAYSYSTGGGIWAGNGSGGTRPLRIINCVVEGNQSSITGGISIEHPNVEIINNTIINNVGGTGGIGINSPCVLLYSNIISGNHGSNGGGVAIAGGYTTVIGNLITNNVASHGGGIYEASSGSMCMTNNTIAYNQADSIDGWGGGICAMKDSLFIQNSIIWNNTGANGSQIGLPAAINESFTSISYCDVMYGQDSIHSDPQATLYWGPGNIDADPQFETGPLGDYHLSYGSPCIDAGNPDLEYNDPEDPFNPGYALWPAMGLVRNDMGAFGGGGVNYWLTVEEEESSSPEAMLVLKSFPNPFSSSCTVCFQIEYPSHVVLSVFDLSGRLVETLVDEVIPAGMYSEYLDGSGLCSGMYLIRLVAGEHAASRRCIVVR